MSEDFEKLQGGFEFPELQGDSRRRELEARYESLTKEEQAELFGLRAFPNNPRGAKLRKKEVLGLLNPEEEKELRRLYQLKDRQENCTPAIQILWERVKASDPNVEQVRMGDGKFIEVAPTEEEKVIWTFGLGRCYATVVFTENKNGTRYCVLTHYPPIQLYQNIDKLGDLIGASEEMRTAKTKKVILALPGEWGQNSETKKYEMRVKDQQAVDALTIAIRAKLGADVDIKLKPYSEREEFWVKDRGILVIYVPPVGKGDVSYRTWYGGGKLTEKSESK